MVRLAGVRDDEVRQLNECVSRRLPTVRSVGLALVFFVLVTDAAFAETTAETASRWGLIGRWSRDCSLPPDHDRGALLSFELAGNGRLIHRRDFGDMQDQAKVTHASISGGNMLNLRIFFPSVKQTREFGLIMQPNGAMRAIYNREKNGKYSIRDGKFTANGQPTPPQYRCDAKAAATASRSPAA